MTKNKPNELQGGNTFKTPCRQRAKEANAAVIDYARKTGGRPTEDPNRKVAKMRANNGKEVVAKPVRVNP